MSQIIADFEARRVLAELNASLRNKLLLKHALGFRIGGKPVYWRDTIESLIT